MQTMPLKTIFSLCHNMLRLRNVSNYMEALKRNSSCPKPRGKICCLETSSHLSCLINNSFIIYAQPDTSSPECLRKAEDIVVAGIHLELSR